MSLKSCDPRKIIFSRARFNGTGQKLYFLWKLLWTSRVLKGQKYESVIVFYRVVHPVCSFLAHRHCGANRLADSVAHLSSPSPRRHYHRRRLRAAQRNIVLTSPPSLPPQVRLHASLITASRLLLAAPTISCARLPVLVAQFESRSLFARLLNFHPH
jgi:hypothetical protein